MGLAAFAALKDLIWPIVAGVVVVAIVALVIRNIRRRGYAERQVEEALAREEKNDEADEIMAEPDLSNADWSDRMRRELGDD